MPLRRPDSTSRAARPRIRATSALQFVDGAESIGFGWYPLGYQKADGSFNSGALGKWGYVWFIGQTNASTARSLVISGTSLNLQTKTNQEAAKDIYLNVRCVKNYTK